MSNTADGTWQLWGMVTIAALSLIPIPKKWAKWNWPMLWPIPSLVLWLSYENALADAGVNIRLDMGLVLFLVTVPVFSTITRIMWRRRNRNPDGLGGVSQQLLEAVHKQQKHDKTQ